MQPSLKTWLTLTALFIALSGCSRQVIAATGNAQAQRTPSMNVMETTPFKWGLYMSHYNADKGTTVLETHERECWMKDAQGNIVMRWLGAGSNWDGGSGPMGGDAKLANLPRTLRLTYYDYLEDRFYQLNTELPIAKLYALFQLKTIDLDWAKGEITPRYEDFSIGIAPQGYVVLWLGGDHANEKIEIGTYQAQVMQGYTAERYNREVQPGFPIEMGANRQAMMAAYMEPETLEKLKQGWLPDNLYYKKQRTKYPWRFAMTGNAQMLEFKERYGNQESTYVHPWQLAAYQSMGQMRGIPASARFIFNDRQGKRYKLFFKFSSANRVAGEADLSSVWAAFKKMFPGRTPENSDDIPGNADMATVEVNASDDLKTFTATLVKGDQRIPLPGRGTQLLPLEPWANNYGGPTPPPGVIKRQQYGPDAD